MKNVIIIAYKNFKRPYTVAVHFALKLQTIGRALQMMILSSRQYYKRSQKYETRKSSNVSKRKKSGWWKSYKSQHSEQF